MIVHSGKMMMRCHYSDCDYIYERRLTSNEPIRNEHIEVGTVVITNSDFAVFHFRIIVLMFND